MSEEFWDAHYRARAGVWLGRANAVLVDVVASLPPGTALDLGCAEGADAVWLAARGWRVTAADVSPTALARAAAHAVDAGVEVDLQHHDLARTFPEGTFDLVSAQYLQSPLDFPRAEVLRKAANAVTPGGLLLVVEHGSVAPWSWNQDAEFPTPEESLAEIGLDRTAWRVERLGAPQREAIGPNRQTATVADIVIALRRV
ncbi:class I SAM-dependent methyltransferase [Umezawaea endophytica]|uniref:Methyltransferase domain-containing protein n=1 Tax=Umezawaea endophytica TaxID=1654476 RepID=A0A9X2VTJ8_9PSEU|nr:class I SAM-dependent methyltransferase [Umezawaea endophytica]MCS7481313.1 methyltransferase domain-containing protein [Umezawaea endophytica]